MKKIIFKKLNAIILLRHFYLKNFFMFKFLKKNCMSQKKTKFFYLIFLSKISWKISKKYKKCYNSSIWERKKIIEKEFNVIKCFKTIYQKKKIIFFNFFCQNFLKNIKKYKKCYNLSIWERKKIIEKDFNVIKCFKTIYL